MNKKSLLLLLLVILLTSCEHVEKVTSNGDKIAKRLAQDLGLSETDPGEIEKLARDEVDKLMQVEYRVEEVPANISGSILEKKLTTLGEDRWDCFGVHLSADGSHLKILCKRKPKSYLRYLTRSF
jgi:hypothetical protein